MYKVMVVDDEIWGRKSISKMIGELPLAVEVVAEATNGQEALELIRLKSPHIVVTDMNMPVMDGERFLESLYTLHSSIKVIVISGYSQFQYMKAALKYRACEYVLKPVSIPDLREAMLKAIEACREYSSMQQQKKSSEEMLGLRRKEFLQHVTGRRIANLSDMNRQAAELDITDACNSYQLAVCMLRQFQETARTKFHGNADLFMFSVENILQEVMQDDSLLIYKTDDSTRLCLILPGYDYNADRTVQLLRDFHQAVSRMLGSDLAVGLSPASAGLELLPEAYAAANTALWSNPLQTQGLSIMTSGGGTAAEEQHVSAPVLSSFDLKELGHAFASGNSKSSRRLLGEFVSKLAKRPDLTIRDAHLELNQIVGLAASEVKGLPSAFPALREPGLLAGILDLRQLSAFVDQLGAAAAAHFQSSEGADSVHIMDRITSFLEARYFENISLIDVATRFHLDPTYLSKLFKSAIGENFVEFMTRKRMEKACELLRDTDRKINEISELVGYENQRYFSQVFKKFTDQTPSEYREHALRPPAKN